MENQDLIHYYQQRAQEYELIYHKPERQADLATLRHLLPEILQDRRVLEIGCGTGYWTAVLAGRCESLLATDINESVLNIARSKSFPPQKVEIQQADMYDLSPLTKDFDGGFAGFVWSHISRERLPDFLTTFHKHLRPGSRVVWLDNHYVEGSNHPLVHTDEAGNTYQRRKLQDGSSHLVMKNFPDEAEFQALLEGIADQVQIRWLEYFWVLAYVVR